MGQQHVACDSLPTVAVLLLPDANAWQPRGSMQLDENRLGRSAAEAGHSAHRINSRSERASSHLRVGLAQAAEEALR